MNRSTELSIATADGRRLGARYFEPVSDPRGQVVIHGATATPRRYYDAFARHLSWLGLRVLTYDYRGIGSSRSMSMVDDPVTMEGWIEDATASQRWLVERDPALPLASIGHSFGGVIAATVHEGRRPDAVVLVGSGNGWWRRYPRSQRPGMWLTWAVAIPALVRTFGYLPGWAGMSEDLPAGVAMQLARWSLTRGFLFERRPDLRARLTEYDGSVLALSFDDDPLAHPQGVRWLLDRLPRARVEHHHLTPDGMGLPPVGHFGAFRPLAAEGLWPLVTRFLLDAMREAGASGSRPPSPAMQEILADLHYGRV